MLGITEGIIISLIVQFGLIIVAWINNRKLHENSAKIDKAERRATLAATAAVTSANEVSGQFKNNGGSTIKDQLDRIENRFLETADRLNLLQETDLADRKAAESAHRAIYDAIDETKKLIVQEHSHTVEEIKHDHHTPS